MARFINPAPQYLDSAANPLVEAQLFFYETGTTLFKNTFADIGLSIPNSNPVILSASGLTPNVFLSGSYRVRLLDKNGVQLWERDPVGGEESLSAFSAWTSLNIYAIPDIVKGSDDSYYISLINNNQGNDPVSTPQAWTEIKFRRVYNANEVYADDDIVYTTDGLSYRSLAAANTGNTPASTPSKWAVRTTEFSAYDAYQADRTYSKNNIVVESDISYSSLTDSNLNNTPSTSPTSWVPTITPILPLPPFGETAFASSTAIDVANGNIQSYTAVANTTFTFSTPPTTTDFYYFGFDLTDGDAFTITWPGSVTWVDGVAPILTAKDRIWFSTKNNGTDWLGSYEGSTV